MLPKRVIILLSSLLSFSRAYPTVGDEKVKVDKWPYDIFTLPIEGHNYTAAVVNYEKFFVVSTEVKMNYWKAMMLCDEYLGMKLIEIDSPKKHEMVKELIKKCTKEGPFWMGASRNKDGETWSWRNGTRITDFYWNNGEPNNDKGTETCIEIYHRDAAWDAQDCRENIYFICEDTTVPIESHKSVNTN